MSRIAILCHSTNPRGGVVHALELGDALVRHGHDVRVHAPDSSGNGFFRATACAAVSLPATPLSDPSDTVALVEARIADYLRHFAPADQRCFDSFHAQDGISGNALAILKARGLIRAFTRTVHHIDTFEDSRLAALQERAIVEADRHVVVSPLWRDELAARYGIAATVVGNGVDRTRFSTRSAPGDILLRRRLGLQSGPVFLAIGGIEARKNPLRILDAFAQVFSLLPGAQLVMAGGTSLLDHSTTRANFSAALAASGLPDHAVVQTGPVEDADMPALYRNADALVFPSLKEGFGLVVLEAMAAGVPVITSRIAPFTSYLDEADVLWCNPEQVSSLADAMMLSRLPQIRKALVVRGAAVAARHDWDAVARAHLAVYAAPEAVAYA